MGVFGKIMDSLRLSDNEDDDYFLDKHTQGGIA